MYIHSVELNNFRNYRSLKEEFHESVNLFLGQNAQGKTNLLESIYITSMGKSFRTNKEKDFIRFGEAFSRVKVTAMKEEELTVEIAVNQEGKKGIKINGVGVKKVSELLENIYIVIFSPEDLKIIKDAPEKRRAYIDRELCQLKPSYYNSLGQYKKVLAQRNRYLKEDVIEKGVIEIWDLQLSQYGAHIIFLRDQFIKKISFISQEIYKNITDGKENLDVSYEPNVPVCLNEKEQQDFFYKILKENYCHDLKNRNTGKGPHKDDLRILVKNIDLRQFGSQGQQRTAALSLKLSETKLIEEETGEKPILLLDDVLSELDQERQNFLIHSLKDLQIFITTTELTPEVKMALPEGKVYFIKEGRIYLKNSEI